MPTRTIEIDLPKKLVIRLATMAAERGLTFNQLVSKFIEEEAASRAHQAETQIFDVVLLQLQAIRHNAAKTEIKIASATIESLLRRTLRHATSTTMNLREFSDFMDGLLSRELAKPTKSKKAQSHESHR